MTALFDLEYVAELGADEWRLLIPADVRAWTSGGEPCGRKPAYFTGIRETDRTWYVYRMWDDDGECLYVGHTGWLRKRINDHKTRARGSWLAYVADIDICACRDREEARIGEQYWYERLSPWFNRIQPVRHLIN